MHLLKCNIKLWTSLLRWAKDLENPKLEIHWKIIVKYAFRNKIKSLDEKQMETNLITLILSDLDFHKLMEKNTPHYYVS